MFGNDGSQVETHDATEVIVRWRRSNGRVRRSLDRFAIRYQPSVNNERFERLLALRGHPVKGLPASAWAANLGDLDRDQVLRAVIETTRKLLLPEWDALRPDDKRPQLALDAAESWLASKTLEAVANAKAHSKDCTAARNEMLGRGHGVPEVARAIAWAAGAKDSSDIWDALCAIESELLARIALISEYQRAPQQRRAIVGALQDMLASKQEAPPATSNDPVPYSLNASFSVGQRVIHSKFGNVLVTAAGDKWIDVQLEDGTTKRCAQKQRGT